jgi:AcrR family transcriptional regulator
MTAPPTTIFRTPPETADRQRLVSAITKAASERGYTNVTVTDVTRYAELSRTTFYEHFTGKRQCLMAAYDAFFERLIDDATAACAAQSEWPERVRAALGAILSFLEESDTLARAFAVESFSSGPPAFERQLGLVERLASLLREGRSHFPAAAALPEQTEQTLAGGVFLLVSARLLAEESLAVPGLRSDLVELVLTPYAGAAEARRIAATEAGHKIPGSSVKYGT